MEIEELIKRMSMRPPMYVHPVTVASIENFLTGFLRGTINGAKNQNPNYEYDSDSADYAFIGYFSKWIFQWIINNIDSKYELPHLALSEIFKSVTKDEDEAVKLFFSLCEKFFKCFHESKDKRYWESLSYLNPNNDDDEEDKT
jgi:hypothetical protein